jgi:hypothetical protein
MLNCILLISRIKNNLSIATVNNCIGGALSAVDRGFDPREGQTIDYKIGICCFSAKQASLRRKSKDWLARNHNNVPECSEPTIYRTQGATDAVVYRGNTKIVFNSTN